MGMRMKTHCFYRWHQALIIPYRLFNGTFRTDRTVTLNDTLLRISEDPLLK